MAKNPETPNLTEISKLEQSLIALSDSFRSHREYIENKFNISALEMQLIQHIMHNGAQKMKDISKYFHIKLSTFTSIIDKAEQSRVLKRVNSKEDRRVVFLDVTAKGRNLYNDYVSALDTLVEKIGIDVDEEQFENLESGLEMFDKLSKGTE
jgi:DNA-binding MarR family transcriptional regulator